MLHSPRNYRLLLSGQFLSAFGDNAILAVIIGQLTYLQQAGAITAGDLRLQNTAYTALLFVPFVLLAPLAGYCNDRYPKTRWLVLGNLIKLIGAAICFGSVGGGPLWQGLGYLCVGIGACLYGPAKYGILPEILPAASLVKANGMVELLTLLAILSGSIAGSLLADAFSTSVGISYAVVMGVFGGATLLNYGMSPTVGNAVVTLRGSVRDFTMHLSGLTSSPRLLRILVGTALFWVCGATLKINFQPWGLEILHLSDNTQVALLGLWLSVGVMAGSILAGKLYPVGELQQTQYYGVLLAGLLGLLYSVGALDLWHAPVVTIGPLRLIVPVVGLLIVTGVVAGLFLIPLNAALQAESNPNALGKTIAVQNLSDNLGMVLASAYAFSSAKLGLSSSDVFLGLAVAILLASTALTYPPAPKRATPCL